MRSRTVREGSVGFLILVGIGLFGGLVLWLRGVQIGNRSYKFVVEFSSAQGMQIGTPVRYRGVSVGKVTALKPGSNGVDVLLEISPGNLVMSRDVAIEAIEDSTRPVQLGGGFSTIEQFIGQETENFLNNNDRTFCRYSGISAPTTDGAVQCADTDLLPHETLPMNT